MQAYIRLFASYRDQADIDRVEVTLPNRATVAQAVEQLLVTHPSLPNGFSPHLIAVNEEFASLDYQLHDGDEIFLYPPVSGGVDVAITTEPLDPVTVASLVRRTTNGAVVTFEGVTRNETRGKEVLFLEYEAHESMAQKTLAQVLVETAQRFGISDLAARHRIGRLEIGNVSLVVAAASPHRNDSFLAVQYAVDRIKQIVPIWKKEYFRDGSVWVGLPEEEDHSHP